MNKYKELEKKDLQKVVGGNKWGSAAIGAMGGAATGIKRCKVVGPWVAAGCGLIGAGIGAWAGYHGS